LAHGLDFRGYTLALCATSPFAVDGALCRAVDVSDPEAVEAFAAEVESEYGPIDVWINNAGILGPVRSFAEADPDEWARCVDVNVMGVINGTRSFLAHRSDAATLVNVASRVVLAPFAGLSAYSATKAAVVAFTKVIAEEEPDIRAIALLPPSVVTDMQMTLQRSDPSDFPYVTTANQRMEEGAIVSPDVGAERILDAIFAPDAPVVVDIT
jgi:NAD(P)-dependent dehydrogenase (short-subunit alcohol dehydrogenase family)